MAWSNRSWTPRSRRRSLGVCARSTSWTARSRRSTKSSPSGPNGSQDARRLMSMPGVGVGVAVTLMAAIGDISRFSSSRQLVAYLGLDPKVRQSGDEPARHGRISKRGNAQARSALVEAAWIAVRQPGPLHAFGERIRARKGSQVAAVAVARKLACLCLAAAHQGRRLRLRAALPRTRQAAPRRTRRRRTAAARHATAAGEYPQPPAERDAERELTEHAEAAYRRLIADWKATGPAKKKGAGATHGRASSKPSKRQAARQAQARTPAL